MPVQNPKRYNFYSVINLYILPNVVVRRVTTENAARGHLNGLEFKKYKSVDCERITIISSVRSQSSYVAGCVLMCEGIYKILVCEGGNSSGPSNRVIEAIGKLPEALSLRNPACSGYYPGKASRTSD